MSDPSEQLRDENAALRAALMKIEGRDWIENALDPQWAASVAKEALGGAGTIEVGSRVRYRGHEGQLVPGEGTVQSVDGKQFWVLWDGETEASPQSAHRLAVIDG